MSYIQQFFTSRDNNANSETFVGQVGRLWWDPVTNQIYSSDGNTPGGIPLSGGGGNVTPGGSNSQVQFNQAGSFGGSAFLTFNVVTGTLTTVAVSATGNITGGNLSAVNLVINSIRSDDSTFVTIEDGVIVNGVITLENGAIIRDSAINTLSIGTGAGNVTNAQDGAIAIGLLAGADGQSYDTVAIGSSAGGGVGFQGQEAVAIGSGAGSNNQGVYAVAIGSGPGADAQGGFAVSIGYQAGANAQGGHGVAIGTGAGNNSQSANAIAVGLGAGSITQGINTVAVGTYAGYGGSFSTNYVSGAVSPSTTLVVVDTTNIVPGMIISGTGFTGNQTVVTVTNATTLAISASANSTPSGELTFTGSQGILAVAIGNSAGQVQQGQYAVAIGAIAGNSGQGTTSVAVGYLSGAVTQGTSAVAIGAFAGATSQGNNSIILNATAANLDQTTANTFTVAPVRNDVSNIGNVMFYNVTSKEITYGNVISVAGNITGSYILGNGSQLTGIAASYGNANVVANLAALGSNPVSTTGNITGGNVLGGANVNATTHTGTTVSVTGAITGGSLTVSTGNVTLGNIINANGNSVGNIGSSSVYFDTIFAKATSAQYADLAEKYTADAQYASGTVLSFGGAQEVTVTLTDADHRVAGVVSNNPATIMNAGLTGEHVATVALTGRVPCSVTGTVRKGDSMVSAGNGVARAEANPAVSTVIGKALEDFDGESGVIEVAVGVR